MRDFLFVLFFILFTCTISTAQNYEQPRDYGNLDSSLSINYNQPTNLNPLNKLNFGSEVWTELNPEVPCTDYWSVDFMIGEFGWAVGKKEAIINKQLIGDTIEKLNTNKYKIFVH